jgi:hypothetical protein
VTLEKLLADALDTTNPLSFAQIMAADERAGLLAEGQWSGMDYWALRLRPVFRRDIALGFGYGVTSSMGAVNVCVAGDRK